MKQFFTAILIISLAGLIILGYYALKNYNKKLKDSKLKQRLFIKYYDDEKTFIRNYFRFLLSLLEKGDIQWIVVSSRRYPWEKIEITYSVINQHVEITDRVDPLDTLQQSDLKQLGLKSYTAKEDLQVLSSSVNPKIVTDLVYYLLESVHNQKKALNMKVTISGGQF